MVISRRQWLLGALVGATVMPLTGCAPGGTVTDLPGNSSGSGSQTTDQPGNSSGSGSQTTDSAVTAAALVRAGAALPEPIASAPIKDGNLTGGTFIIYSLTTAGASTLLQFGVDYPGKRVSGGLDLGHEWEATLVAGGQTTWPTAWYYDEVFNRDYASGLQTRVFQAYSPARVSMVASYPALPADVTQVEVKSPLFGSLTVAVNRTLDIPAGSPDIPILGRIVYQDSFHPDVATPLIVTVHAVRRIPNGTAVYYSLAFPEGTTPVPPTRLWGGTHYLLSWHISYKQFPDGFGVIDRSSMTGYSQLTVHHEMGKPSGVVSRIRILDEGLGKGNVMAGIAILPPLPATTSRVDVLIGGQQLIQDVPVADGALTPPGGPTETILGTGWPSYNDTALAGVTNEETLEATCPLFERIKVDSVTTGNHTLDLESDVLFDYNKATLTPKADRVITKAVTLITANGKPGKLTITGYTDNTGNPTTNKALSLRRAQAVTDRLKTALPAGYTFNVTGKGEADPVASNKNAAGRALNRRVEIALP